MEEISGSVPIGFVFQPSESDIMEYFLPRRLADLPFDHPLHDNLIKKNIDIYESKKKPSEIFKNGMISGLRNNEENFYFFTCLKKLNDGKARNSRSAGEGTWKNERVKNIIREINTENLINGYQVIKEEVVGNMRLFKYMHKDNDPCVSWLMHEYSLKPEFNPLRHMVKPENNNIVLCHLKKITKEAKKRSISTINLDQDVSSSFQNEIFASNIDYQPSNYSQVEDATSLCAPQERVLRSDQVFHEGIQPLQMISSQCTNASDNHHSNVVEQAEIIDDDSALNHMLNDPNHFIWDIIDDCGEFHDELGGEFDFVINN